VPSESSPAHRAWSDPFSHDLSVLPFERIDISRSDVMSHRLQPRVAIVTGAAQGIGRAYAQALADDGATVVVADLKAQAAQQAADEIVSGGGTALACAVDVGDEASVLGLRDFVRDTCGRADIVVNNAAVYEDLQRTTLSAVSLEYWRRLFAVNVEGTLTCSRAFAPMMAERGWGRIVNQSSVGAYMGNPSVYGITKLAVVGLTQGLARELGPQGITVNAIAPGTIHTAATMKVVSPAMLTRQRDRQCVDIEGQPEHLVDTLRYLVSDGASFVTGQTIFVDGGAEPRL
jgi:3-oxoacyl-[acyl-carrier protein] reductase